MMNQSLGGTFAHLKIIPIGLFRDRISCYYPFNDSELVAYQYWRVANSRKVGFYVHTRKAVINIHPPLFPFDL
ncbi:MULTISPECIES: hypothetical protein [unclassified Microcoleus]|uniref:hypothetical protein n=1 Tax=unclassified Microcoleus TaxID=2642155 RepID=UPI002FD4D2EF